jgi:hypothetical protein
MSIPQARPSGDARTEDAISVRARPHRLLPSDRCLSITDRVSAQLMRIVRTAPETMPGEGPDLDRGQLPRRTTHPLVVVAALPVGLDNPGHPSAEPPSGRRNCSSNAARSCFVGERYFLNSGSPTWRSLSNSANHSSSFQPHSRREFLVTRSKRMACTRAEPMVRHSGSTYQVRPHLVNQTTATLAIDTQPLLAFLPHDPRSGMIPHPPPRWWVRRRRCHRSVEPPMLTIS